jgi:hypothetical protein
VSGKIRNMERVGMTMNRRLMDPIYAVSPPVLNEANPPKMRLESDMSQIKITVFVGSFRRVHQALSCSRDGETRALRRDIRLCPYRRPAAPFTEL